MNILTLFGALLCVGGGIGGKIVIPYQKYTDFLADHCIEMETLDDILTFKRTSGCMCVVVPMRTINTRSITLPGHISVKGKQWSSQSVDAQIVSNVRKDHEMCEFDTYEIPDGTKLKFPDVCLTLKCKFNSKGGRLVIKEMEGCKCEEGDFPPPPPTAACDYSQINGNHSWLGLPVNECDFHKSGVTEDDIKIILNIHNTLRSEVANGTMGSDMLPQAANMMEMEWDEELAGIAQGWANQCVFGHDCGDCRKTCDGESVGQNAFKSSRSGTDQIWETAVQMWYDEIQFFSSAVISPFTYSSNTGHFTQVAWAASGKIGCGGIIMENDSFDGVTTYICNYQVAGNMDSGVMYVSGAPASDCPSGSSPSTTYPFLCKAS